MIRLAKLSEIEEIISITRACAAKMINNNIYQWNENYPNEQAFVEDVNRKELFVLQGAQEIIGCIAISSRKDDVYESVNWLTDDSTQFYIHRLAVAPKYQHQGYAKMMMDFAESYCIKKNAVSIRLDTFSANKRNQRFYESRGYKKLEDIYFPKQSELPFHCYELIL